MVVVIIGIVRPAVLKGMGVAHIMVGGLGGLNMLHPSPTDRTVP